MVRPRTGLLACTLLAALWGVVAQEDVGEEVGNSSSAKSRPALGQQIAGTHLAKMMQTYDPFIAPGNSLTEREQTVVKVSLGIMAIHGVSIVEGHFETSLFINLRWKDPRLLFKQKEAGVKRFVLTGLQQSSIWLPLAYVSHTISFNEFFPKYTALVSEDTTPEDGFHVRHQITNSFSISETFDVAYFPFDVQKFTVKVNPEMNHDEMKLSLGTRFSGGPIFFKEGLEAGALKCPDGKQYKQCVRVHEKTAKYQSGSYSYIYFDFYLKRMYWAYVLTWFVPLQLIWVIAYLTYYQDPSNGDSGRDGITITSLLAMTFYQSEIKAVLPRVAYVTWIEVYLFVYIGIIAQSCICFVLVITQFRDNGPYDKLVALIKKHEESGGGEETARLMAEHDEEKVAEISALLNKDEDDTDEKYKAVWLDMAHRKWIPIFTFCFNLLAGLALLTPYALRMPPDGLMTDPYDE